MEERNPALVVLFTVLTLGIYGIYWSYKTHGELKELGEELPPFVLLLVPVVNLYYLYKYIRAVESATEASIGVQAIILLFIGLAYPGFVQHKLNGLNETEVNDDSNSPDSGLQPLDTESDNLEPLSSAPTPLSHDEETKDQPDTEERVDVAIPDMDDLMSSEDQNEEQDKEKSLPDEDTLSADAGEKSETTPNNPTESQMPEQIAEEVEQLLVAGKDQKAITVKLRGEGVSDELISKAYEIENEKHGY